MNTKKINLFLLTDSFPFGKGEDFIMNELDTLSKIYDKIYIIPTGIMCDTSIHRDVPNNIKVFLPPQTKYLFKNNAPTIYMKIFWLIRYLGFWCFKSLISKEFYSELKYLIKNNSFSLKKVFMALKSLAPCIRNIFFYKKVIMNDLYSKDGNVIYSFWFDYSQYMMKTIMKKNNIFKPIYCFSRGHRHDIYVSESQNQYLPFRELYFESIDDLYLSTKDGYEYMLNNYNDKKEKIHLSYLGTRDHGIKRVSSSKPFRIVSCSFLSSVKRVNLIIDALSMFSIEDIEWIHFGDGQLTKEIKNHAIDKLEGKIHYIFKGYVPNREMINYYLKNDVHLFINTSESEGLPVSIQEAISFGIPIIATNVGSTKEAVIDKYNGILLEKNFDTKDLYQHIKLFYNMKEKDYQQFRLNSRILWEENFNAQQIYYEFFTTVKNKYL